MNDLIVFKRFIQHSVGREVMDMETLGQGSKGAVKYNGPCERDETLK